MRTDSKLPADIFYVINEEGAFIEVESLINFLRDDKNVPTEYKDESVHLKKLAEYLEEQFGELLAQKMMLDDVFNKDRPN